MFKNHAGRVRSGWIILIAFIAVLIVQQLFSLPGLFLLIAMEMTSSAGFNPNDIQALFNSHPWLFLIVQGGSTLGGILITFLLWRFVNKGSLKELGFRGSMKQLSFGLLLGAVSITLIFFVLMATGNVTLVNSFSNPQFTIFTISYLILFILVGLFEEMFFRGYIMSTMASRGNKKWAIYVVSALIFSIAHGANPNVSVLGLVNIALVGLLFAYMFDVTNSLWIPIGYHITWNYFQGNIFGFAVSGLAPYSLYTIDVSHGYTLLTGGAFGLEGGILATIFIFIGFIATKYYAKYTTSKD